MIKHSVAVSVTVSIMILVSIMVDPLNWFTTSVVMVVMAVPLGAGVARGRPSTWSPPVRKQRFPLSI